MNAPLSDDEFVARLRHTAWDAAGRSGLDVDAVLRSSRRKHRVRRTGYAAAAGLVLSTAGFGAAGAIPGVPGVWNDGPVQVEPSVSADPTAVVVDVSPDTTPKPATSGPSDLPTAVDSAERAVVTTAGPGVRQVANPVTVTVDTDTLVLDLGLGAWVDGRRFFAVVELAPKDGGAVWKSLRIVAGTDQDFRVLSDGGQAGTVLWDGVTNDAMVQRADGAASLVFGIVQPGQGGAQHLLLDEPLVPDDPSTTSVEIATADLLGDGEIGIRVAEVRSAVPPRGFVHSAGETWGASWCRETSSTCTVVYDPARNAVVPPEDEESPALIEELGRTMAEASDQPVITAMEACVAQRTGEAWQAASGLTADALGTTPDGIDPGQWRLCLLDLSEAADALRQGLIDVHLPDSRSADANGEGTTPTSPDGSGPSDRTGPIESVTDQLGGLLDRVFGGETASSGSDGASDGKGTGAEDDDAPGGEPADSWFGDSGG